MGEATVLTARRYGLILIILCLCAVINPIVSADDDGVVLPAEWYFGRWAQGTQINITKLWQNGTASRESGEGSYTAGNYRVLADDIFRDYLIVSHDSKATVTSRLYASCRPSSNLQVGLVPLRLIFTDDTKYPSSDMPQFRQTERKDYYFGWRIDWLSVNDAPVTEDMARFSYFVDTVVAPGQWLIRANGSIEPDLYKSVTIEDLGNNTSEMSSQNGEYFPYSARAKVHYGLTEHIVIGLSSALTSYSGSTERGESGAPDWIEQVRTDERDSKSINIGLEPVVRPVESIYMRGGVILDFDRDTFKRRYSANFDSTEINDQGRLAKISRDGYAVSMDINYITKGEFDSRIVIDDFNDFYRGQLFKGQLHGAISMGYRYSESTSDYGVYTSHRENRKAGNMSASISYGITAQLAASARASYNWGRFRSATASESLRPYVELAFRSFRYSPEDGPTWNSVSDLEIATGPVIPAGQFYARSQVSFGSYSSPRESNPGFLAFQNLSGGRVRYIETSVTTGVGVNTEIGARFAWQHGNDSDNTEHWNVIVRSHLVSRFQLQLEAKYHTVEGKHSGIEPLLYGYLTALL